MGAAGRLKLPFCTRAWSINRRSPTSCVGDTHLIPHLRCSHLLELSEEHLDVTVETNIIGRNLRPTRTQMDPLMMVFHRCFHFVLLCFWFITLLVFADDDAHSCTISSTLHKLFCQLERLTAQLMSSSTVVNLPGLRRKRHCCAVCFICYKSVDQTYEITGEERQAFLMFDPWNEFPCRRQAGGRAGCTGLCVIVMETLYNNRLMLFLDFLNPDVSSGLPVLPPLVHVLSCHECTSDTVPLQVPPDVGLMVFGSFHFRTSGFLLGSLHEVFLCAVRFTRRSVFTINLTGGLTEVSFSSDVFF